MNSIQPVWTKLRLDDINLKILDELSMDSRISMTDLADKVHVSRPTVARRIALMEEYGIIKGFTVMIDWGLIEQDEEGRTFINAKSERAPQFMQELTEIGTVECTVDVCTVTVADILDQLTGEEMGGIAWMVEDWDDAS